MKAGETMRGKVETGAGEFDVTVTCTGKGGWLAVAPARKKKDPFAGLTRLVPLRWLPDLERDLAAALPN